MIRSGNFPSPAWLPGNERVVGHVHFAHFPEVLPRTTLSGEMEALRDGGNQMTYYWKITSIGFWLLSSTFISLSLDHPFCYLPIILFFCSLTGSSSTSSGTGISDKRSLWCYVGRIDIASGDVVVEAAAAADAVRRTDGSLRHFLRTYSVPHSLARGLTLPSGADGDCWRAGFRPSCCLDCCSDSPAPQSTCARSGC